MSAPVRVCCVDFLFHYLLGADERDVEPMVETGIRPLSAFPDSERWQAIERAAPGVFEEIYDELAKPVVRHPYAHSGIFLTPIDFRLLPDLTLSTAPRFRVPVERLDPDVAALTFLHEERRHCLPLTTENLETASAMWTAADVRRWFGFRNDRMFWYVPQVAYYPEPAVLAVTRADYEPA